MAPPAARRARRGASVLALCALVVMGCAESTRIVSRPSGAHIQIDGRPLGVTPMTFTVPRSEWPRTYSCQVSKEGFVPQTVLLKPQIGGGRIVAGLFTVGLVFLFKSPYVFGSDIYDVDLAYDMPASAGSPPSR